MAFNIAPDYLKAMRIIHTADWHLGKRLNNHSRAEEHDCFLNWLARTIDEQKVDALVVAGDIFDAANPSHESQAQYYRFLHALQGTHCKDVVLISGNHDGANFLSAPQALLKVFNVHVVSAALPDGEAQCIALPTGAPKPSLVVAAIPFLRDGDLRTAALGQSEEQQNQNIQQGIARHYAIAADCIRHHRAQGVPVLATGHLYTKGGTGSEASERSIQLGTLGHVEADAFTDAFDYVALGHLHKHQVVSGFGHIRYSGSPIPLSFAEADYGHQVLMLDFEGAAQPSVTPLTVPCVRRLVNLEGTIEEVMEKLDAWDNGPYPLPAFIFAKIIGSDSPVLVSDQLNRYADANPHRMVLNYRVLPKEEEKAQDPLELQDIINHPEQMFARLLDSRALSGPARTALEQSFAELLTMDIELEESADQTTTAQ